MRVVVQRAKNASVVVEEEVVGKINYGLVLLIAFTNKDNNDIIDYMVNKIINLRIFDDENGIMNKSLLDIEGQILSISQFTLYANSQKGNRPSYAKALNSKEANILYNYFNNKIKEKNIKIETGIFQKDMQLTLTNDGPVTIILEKEVK